MTLPAYGEVSWKRMSDAVERVRERLLRAARALDAARVAYAIAGGNAVAAWVSRVDESAVRNTQDVGILLRRSDLATAKRAHAVHVIFAGELVRADYPLPAPLVEESERSADFALLSLDALVRMKLTSFRDKDRVHVRDLIEARLVDRGWLARLPPPLADRLLVLLENPEG